MSDLVPYLVTDFWWDSISDQRERTDVSDVVSVQPKLTYVPHSARQRFTKYNPPRRPILRLDLTLSPRSFVNVTQRVPEHNTTQSSRPTSDRTSRDLSRTIHRFDRFGWGGKRL